MSTAANRGRCSKDIIRREPATGGGPGGWDRWRGGNHGKLSLLAVGWFARSLSYRGGRCHGCAGRRALTLRRSGLGVAATPPPRLHVGRWVPLPARTGRHAARGRAEEKRASE